MALAGPAINLVLWLGCDALGTYMYAMASSAEDATSTHRGGPTIKCWN